MADTNKKPAEPAANADQKKAEQKTVPVFKELTRINNDQEGQAILWDKWGSNITLVENIVNGAKEDIENGESYFDTISGALKKIYNDLNSSSSENSNGINQLPSATVDDALASIFGMPYQFSEIVDPPYTYITKGETTVSSIGNKFLEKIFSMAPIVFLSPGEPEFLAGSISKELIDSWAAKFLSASNGEIDSVGQQQDGKFYGFKNTFVEYAKYVNTAVRGLSLFLGIGDEEIPVPGKNTKIKLNSFHIEDMMGSEYERLFGTLLSIPFYIDAESSITESFGNSTTESMVAQTVQPFTDQARELMYLTGTSDAGGLGRSLASLLAKGVGAFNDALQGVVNSQSILSRLGGEIHAIVGGGRLTFPEVWADSTYGKSYDINIKLRSPDPDPISIFLNIYLPIIILICMTVPRQYEMSSNAYSSPFIIRAVYKSIFSVEMGIIDSLSITKGGDGRWNELGMPTAADVSFSIKELYNNTFISKGFGLLRNTSQLDYLATLAGNNLNEPEVFRRWRLFFILAKQVPADMVRGVRNAISTKVLSLMNRTARFFGGEIIH